MKELVVTLMFMIYTSKLLEWDALGAIASLSFAIYVKSNL